MARKPEETMTTPIIIDPNMLNNYYNQGDEISLVELWRSLVEQKTVFFATFLIILIAGCAFSLIQPTLYEYSTTIEIGTQADIQL